MSAALLAIGLEKHPVNTCSCHIDPEAQITASFPNVQGTVEGV